MYFQNGPDTPTTTEARTWHHIGVFELVEFSKALDVSKRCSDTSWRTLRTWRATGQVWIALAQPAWTPMSIAYQCE
jgi:hypothetical protein